LILLSLPHQRKNEDNDDVDDMEDSNTENKATEEYDAVEDTGENKPKAKYSGEKKDKTETVLLLLTLSFPSVLSI